jgi:hypothetical protein
LLKLGEGEAGKLASDRKKLLWDPASLTQLGRKAIKRLKDRTNASALYNRIKYD